jgi:hypothetical protein
VIAEPLVLDDSQLAQLPDAPSAPPAVSAPQPMVLSDDELARLPDAPQAAYAGADQAGAWDYANKNIFQSQPSYGAASNLGRSTLNSAVNATAHIAGSVGDRFVRGMSNVFGDSGGPSANDDLGGVGPINPTQELLDPAIRQQIDKAIPYNPSTVSGHAGQIVGGIAPVAVASVAGGTPAVLMSAFAQGDGGAAQEVEQLRAAGHQIDDAAAEKYRMAAGFINAAMAVAGGKAGEGIVKGITGASAKELLARAGGRILLGAGEGAAGAVVQNRVAQHTVEPERPTSQGVAEAAMSNAALTGVFAAKHAMSERVNGRPTPQEGEQPVQPEAPAQPPTAELPPSAAVPEAVARLSPEQAPPTPPSPEAPASVPPVQGPPVATVPETALSARKTRRAKPAPEQATEPVAPEQAADSSVKPQPDLAVQPAPSQPEVAPKASPGRKFDSASMVERAVSRVEPQAPAEQVPFKPTPKSEELLATALSSKKSDRPKQETLEKTFSNLAWQQDQLGKLRSEDPATKIEARNNLLASVAGPIKRNANYRVARRGGTMGTPEARDRLVSHLMESTLRDLESGLPKYDPAKGDVRKYLMGNTNSEMNAEKAVAKEVRPGGELGVKRGETGAASSASPDHAVRSIDQKVGPDEGISKAETLTSTNIPREKTPTDFAEPEGDARQKGRAAMDRRLASVGAAVETSDGQKQIRSKPDANVKLEHATKDSPVVLRVDLGKGEKLIEVHQENGKLFGRVHDPEGDPDRNYTPMKPSSEALVREAAGEGRLYPSREMLLKIARGIDKNHAKAHDEDIPERVVYDKQSPQEKVLPHSEMGVVESPSQDFNPDASPREHDIDPLVAEMIADPQKRRSSNLGTPGNRRGIFPNPFPKKTGKSAADFVEEVAQEEAKKQEGKWGTLQQLTQFIEPRQPPREEVPREVGSGLQRRQGGQHHRRTPTP